jgi:hypothetical protein
MANNVEALQACIYCPAGATEHFSYLSLTLFTPMGFNPWLIMSKPFRLVYIAPLGQLTTFLFITLHSSLQITHNPRLTTHGRFDPDSYRGINDPRISTWTLILIHFSRRPTAYHSLLTTNYLLYTPHCSLLTTHYSLLITHNSQLTTYYSLLTIYYSLLSIHCSLFTLHSTLPVTERQPKYHFSLFTIHYSAVRTPRPPYVADCNGCT